MAIVFWSTQKGVSGVTAVVAAITVVWAECIGQNVYVSSNHISDDDINRVFLGIVRRHYTMVHHYYYSFGEPEYYRFLRVNPRKKRKVGAGITYLPMEGTEEAEYFSGTGLKGVLKESKDAYLLIDAAAGGNDASERLLKASEVRVVVLPPDRDSAEKTLRAFSDDENCFFIFGNYGKCGPMDISAMLSENGISEQRAGCVPYCEEYELALWSGSAYSFLRSVIFRTNVGETSFFVNSLLLTAEKLRVFADQRRYGNCTGFEGA